MGKFLSGRPPHPLCNLVGAEVKASSIWEFIPSHGALVRGVVRDMYYESDSGIISGVVSTGTGELVAIYPDVFDIMGGCVSISSHRDPSLPLSIFDKIKFWFINLVK